MMNWKSHLKRPGLFLAKIKRPLQERKMKSGNIKSQVELNSLIKILINCPEFMQKRRME
jgi:hypothetical protein